MPKPAPAFNKQNGVEAENDLPSFRVQTAAPPSNLSANVSQNVVSLQSSVIKTSPSQHQGMASVPPDAFRSWIEQAHPKFALSASTIDSETLLEVKGMYDNSRACPESS